MHTQTNKCALMVVVFGSGRVGSGGFLNIVVLQSIPLINELPKLQLETQQAVVYLPCFAVGELRQLPFSIPA